MQATLSCIAQHPQQAWSATVVLRLYLSVVVLKLPKQLHVCFNLLNGFLLCAIKAHFGELRDFKPGLTQPTLT